MVSPSFPVGARVVALRAITYVLGNWRVAKGALGTVVARAHVLDTTPVEWDAYPKQVTFTSSDQIALAD
jgi:hypothetical protein